MIIFLPLIFALFYMKSVPIVYESDFEANTNKPIKYENSYIFVNKAGNLKIIEHLFLNFYQESFIPSPIKGLQVFNSGIIEGENLYFVGTTRSRDSSKNVISKEIVISKFNIKSQSFLKQKLIAPSFYRIEQSTKDLSVASRSKPIIHKDNLYFAFGHIFREPQDNFSGFIVKTNLDFDENSKYIYHTSPTGIGGGIWGFDAINLHINHLYFNIGNCYGNFFSNYSMGGDSVCSSIGILNLENFSLENLYTPPFFEFLDDGDIDICVGPYVLDENILMSIDKGGVIYLLTANLQLIYNLKLPNLRINCTTPYFNYQKNKKKLDIIYTAYNDSGEFSLNLSEINLSNSKIADAKIKADKIYANGKSYINSKIYKSKNKKNIYFVECYEKKCSIVFLDINFNVVKKIEISGEKRIFEDNLLEDKNLIISSSINKIQLFELP